MAKLMFSSVHMHTQDVNGLSVVVVILVSTWLRWMLGLLFVILLGVLLK